MKIARLISFFCGFAAIIAIVISSCKHGCGREGGNSAHDLSDSHNMGLNCMNCHSGTGGGEGCFAIAGTIHGKNRQTELPNATVKLFSGPDGSGKLLRTIAADALGNFYSGSTEGLTGTYYPIVVSSTGAQDTMREPVTVGACNSCHGVTTEKIWVD